MRNILLNTDSYKASHFLQYPPGTEYVSSYIESRGGNFDSVVFFGLQVFLQQYLSQAITQSDIDEAEGILLAHGLPFNRTGWQGIVDDHRGLLPVEIQALPEGQVLPTKQVLVQVINTDPAYAWLTSYLETALLRAVWYPTTVASLSYACRQTIAEYLQRTSDNVDGLDFKLHDFGARGASSEETAALGSAAHLVNFKGTDTLSGILLARDIYSEPMAGFSIPAAEHSTITCWGRAQEVDAYENMLEQFSAPGKTVAVVSDSYDLWHAIDRHWGSTLKAKVESSGGTLVVRPDSGDPVPIVIGTIERLMKIFGYKENKKGFRCLPEYIRVIQGDGIDLTSLSNILAAMEKRTLSADNIVFGMGGGLLQQVNRDTLQFAMKASAAYVNGQWRDVYKDPMTDQGKRSKRGRLALIRHINGDFATIREESLGGQKNILQAVYRNGAVLTQWSFDEIRRRARAESL